MFRMLDIDCDPEIVEDIIDGATEGMERAVENATTEEVVSAVFTLLDRTLRAKRKLQPSSERFTTAASIRRLLTDMIADHGTVPS